MSGLDLSIKCVFLFLGITLLGCGSQPQGLPEKPPPPPNLSETEVLNRFQDYRLSFEREKKTRIFPSQHKKLPSEPVTMFTIRIKDDKGNSERMTLIQFDNYEDPKTFKKQKINGFPVRNWFFLGIINNYFKQRVEEALQ